MPLRLPPSHIVREAPPPDNQLLVVRGGRNSLSDANLERASGDCWEQHGFFGISVFGAPDDDLLALSEAVGQIRRRHEVRLARCGELRSAGFEVAATFSNPLHFSVVLPDADTLDLRGLTVVLLGADRQSGLRTRQVSRIMQHVANREPAVELWVDDHQEYEPGVVHGHLRHARVPMDPRRGDFLIVGDDESPPVLAEVLERRDTGELRLRLLPGRPDSHPEFRTRRLPTAV